MTPETDGDGILWKIVGAIVTGIIGFVSLLFARAVKKHDEEIAFIRSDIKAVFDKMDTKSDKFEQQRMRDHIEELFKQSRTDKEAVLTAIGDLKTAIIEGLNKRPTRDELSATGGQRRRGYEKP